MIVPVLTLWLGTPFRRAVAHLARDHRPDRVAALASHLLTGARPDLAITATLALATGAGALLGTLFAERVPAGAPAARRSRVLVDARSRSRCSIDVLALGGPPA